MTTLSSPVLSIRLRRVRRWFVWAGLAAAVLLILAYALLPWYAPVGWLARQFSHSLSETLHRPVQIDRLSLSWSEGVLLEGLTIEEPAGPGRPSHLLRLTQARCGLTPLTTLFRGKLDRLELDGLHLWVALLPDGRLNLDDLVGDERRNLPTLNLVFRNAVLHLDVPDLPAQCRMDRLECRFDDETGLLLVNGDADVHRKAGELAGQFHIDGQVRVPRLKRGVNLIGGGRLTWENVELADVPFHRLPAWGIQRLEGRTSGRIAIETFPDLGIDFAIDTRLDGVTLHRRDALGPDHIRDGQFRATGHLNPHVDRLVIDKLDYSIPALRIHDTGTSERPALVYEQRDPERLRLDVAGEVSDLVLLCREFPTLDDLLGRFDAEAEGACGFTLQLSRSVARDRAQITVDAHDAALAWADRARLDAGMPKQLVLDASLSATRDRVDVHEARLMIDDSFVSASGLFPLPAAGETLDWPRLERALCDTTAEGRLHTPHTEQFAVYFPALDRALGPGRREGPFECAILLAPTPDGATLQWRVTSPVGATAELGEMFHKPADVALLAHGAWRWEAAAPGQLRDLQAECSIGQARLALAGAETAYVINTTPGEPDVRAKARLPLVLSNVEHLRRFLPSLDRQMRDGPDGPIDVAGTLRLQLDGEIQHRASDLTWSLRGRADLLSSEVRVGDAFHSPVGTPTSITVTHRLARTATDIEHGLELDVAPPGAVFTAQYCIAGAAGAGVRVAETTHETLHVEARIPHVRETLDVLPALSRQLTSTQLDGSATATVDVTRTPEGEAIRLRCDTGGLQGAIPGEASLFKAAGVPCRLELDARRAAVDDVWHIEPGSARLAACTLRWEDGQCDVSPDWAAWWSRRGLSPSPGLPEGYASTRPAGPPIERLELTASIQAEIDPALRSLSPMIEGWITRLGLVGQLAGQFDLHASPQSQHVAGTLNATAARVSVMLPDATRFTKPIGTDATIAFDAEHTRGADAAGGTLVVRQATLASRENTLELAGQIAPREGWVNARAELDRLDQLQTLLDGHNWPAARGALSASIELVLGDNGWSVPASNVTLRNVALQADDMPIHMNGRVELTDNAVLLDTLDVRAGTSELTLSGSVRVSREEPAGQIGVYAPRLDLEELDRLYHIIQARLPSGPEAEPGSFHSAFMDALCRLKLEAQVKVDRFRVVMPALQLKADSLVTGLEVMADEGTIELPWRASVDGGFVEGNLTYYLQEAEPYFDLEYEAHRLAPEALVQDYLRRSFPGFIATGPLTLIDRSLQRLDPPADQPNYPVGSGELIIEGGTVRGKAAPDWMVRIFPGLNLTQYEFDLMHDWFTKFADGRIEHRMIFQGRYYHLYMDGHTDAEQNVQYEVGVDLLAGLDSRYWAETRQGRIPLFIKTGRLTDDGTLDPDNVRFSPMYRVIESLAVKNNPALTIYHAIRKQILNEN